MTRFAQIHPTRHSVPLGCAVVLAGCPSHPVNVHRMLDFVCFLIEAAAWPCSGVETNTASIFSISLGANAPL